MTIGTKVRFVIDHLGAQRSMNGKATNGLQLVPGVVPELFGRNDHGVVAFPHPNERLKDWWYVEVDSRTEPGLKLYVSASPFMVEVEK